MLIKQGVSFILYFAQDVIVYMFQFYSAYGVCSFFNILHFIYLMWHISMFYINKWIFKTLNILVNCVYDVYWCILNVITRLYI